MEAHSVMCNLRTQSFVHYVRDLFIIPKWKLNKYLSSGELSNLPEVVLKKHFKLIKVTIKKTKIHNIFQIVFFITDINLFARKITGIETPIIGGK